MFQLAVCDDQKNSLEATAQLIREGNFSCAVQLFSDSKSLLQSHANTPFDIVVMDIMLGEENGIDVAGQLHAIHPAAQIIFMSTSNEYMYDAYRVPHVWYINKADAATLLPQALHRAADALSLQANTRLILHCGGTVHIVPCADVLYFEQLGRKACTHTAAGIFTQYQKITEYLTESAYPGFVQCHKSFIVNMAQVKTLTHSTLILSDGTTLPISRRCLPNIQNYLIADAEHLGDAAAEEGAVL